MNDGITQLYNNPGGEMIFPYTVPDAVITGDEGKTLTEDLKEINNNINFISVKNFGGKGDGITDDTDAVFNCLSSTIASNSFAYFPKGEYIIRPNILNFELNDKETFKICGDGENSIIKRKDNTVDGDWYNLFILSTNTNNLYDINMIYIKDIKIDSNARNQQEPEDSYSFEHCADIRITGKKNSYIKKVFIENVIAYDGIADHIYIAGSTDAYVKELYINNFLSYGRTRTRSDICVTGYIEKAFLSNISSTSIEYELNNASDFEPTNLYLNNINTDSLDLAANKGIINLKGSNIKTNKSTYFASILGLITSSEFYFKSGNRFVYNENLKFCNCIFKINSSEDNILNTINIMYYNKIDFDCCDFLIDGDQEFYTGPLITTQPIKPVNGIINISFNSCNFDNRSEIGVSFLRSGYGLIKNCIFYNKIGIQIYGNPDYPLSVDLINVYFNNIGNWAYIRGGSETGFELNMQNIYCTENNFITKIDNSSCANFKSLFSDRKIILTQPLTAEFLKEKVGGKVITLFNGDTFINKNSLLSEPKYWFVTETNYAHQINKDLKILANGFSLGTSEERPKCYLQKGYIYFDLDLNQNIFWNGTNWIKADGTVVKETSSEEPENNIITLTATEFSIDGWLDVDAEQGPAGDIVSSGDDKATDFIEIPSGTTSIKVTVTNNAESEFNAVAFYDSNKTFSTGLYFSNLGWSNNTTTITNNNHNYLRISNNTGMISHPITIEFL